MFRKGEEYKSLFFYGQGGLVYEESGNKAFDDICLIGQDELIGYKGYQFSDNIISSQDDTMISSISYQQIKILFGVN